MEQMRVLLLGAKCSGKSSVINTVFGKNLTSTDRRTIHCKTLQGNVHGRELMLVDTPGWWKDYPLSDTPTCVKHELLHGVTLCSPGPHVILLVIDCGLPFKKKQRKSIEDHLGLLTDQIWAHVLVLFTRHCLPGAETKTVEECIESGGEALQWVTEKCGHRCHFFDNTVPNDISQVCSLLDKIEDIIQTNNKAYFTIDPKILQESEEWRKNVMSRARDREIRIQQQQQNYNKELRMMLVGWVMSGKSASGNTILNKDEFAHGKRTDKCKIGHGDISGRPVTVIDTPSWWKFFPSQYTPERIKSEILDGAFQKNNSLHSILLVIPADTSFKEEQRNVIEENMKILGEQVWKHTIILFTWGDMLGDMTIEQHIESEGEDLQVLVEKCGNRYHVFDNEKRESRAQVTELLQKIDEMVSRNFTLVHLSTETRERETEADNESVCDKGNFKEVMSVIYEEWRRRDEEFLKTMQIIKDIWAGAHMRSKDKSMDSNINFNKSDPDTEMEETNAAIESLRELQSNRHLELQGEKTHMLKLGDSFKDMLDREWFRREDILLTKLQELLRTDKFETSSEPDYDQQQFSKQKVSNWLKHVSEPSDVSGYASASDSSDLQDMSGPPTFLDQEDK